MEFIASALIKQVAKQIKLTLQIGMMLADQMTYAKTCDPQNVAVAIEKNRMKDYFFADVGAARCVSGICERLL